MRSLSAGQGTGGKVWLPDSQELETRKSSVVLQSAWSSLFSSSEKFLILLCNPLTRPQLEEPDNPGH